MKIAFLMGDTAISGGTYVILQHALFLCRQGHDVTIYYITHNCDYWHESFKQIKFINIHKYNFEYFDLVIATWWLTVYNLEKFISKYKCYFVQSIESFFPKDSEIELKKAINSTYSINIPIITEASWIKDYLFHKYNITSTLVLNGIRKDIFYPSQNLKRKNRILIEGPIDCDFKNVPRTIQLCKKYTHSELWLLTSSKIKNFHGVSKVFSCIPALEVGKIYRECDFIVKLSYVEGMFAPPLEMFHCGGTAIVYNVTGHDEYMVNMENSIVIKEGDEKSVIKALHILESDDDLLYKLKTNAIKTANEWPDWNTSSREFERALLQIQNTNINFNKLYPLEKIVCSKNTLRKFLSKIKRHVYRLLKPFICQYIYVFLPNRGKRNKSL